MNGEGEIKKLYAGPVMEYNALYVERQTDGSICKNRAAFAKVSHVKTEKRPDCCVGRGGCRGVCSGGSGQKRGGSLGSGG